MGDVLRIIDRFKITGHGVIYTVKISKGANVRMGDLLSDLRGNRFEGRGQMSVLFIDLKENMR